MTRSFADAEFCPPTMSNPFAPKSALGECVQFEVGCLVGWICFVGVGELEGVGVSIRFEGGVGVDFGSCFIGKEVIEEIMDRNERKMVENNLPISFIE